MYNMIQDTSYINAHVCVGKRVIAKTVDYTYTLNLCQNIKCKLTGMLKNNVTFYSVFQNVLYVETQHVIDEMFFIF